MVLFINITVEIPWAAIKAFDFVKPWKKEKKYAWFI